MLLLRRFHSLSDAPFSEVMDLGTFVSESDVAKAALSDLSGHPYDSRSEYFYAVYDGSHYVGTVPFILS